MTKWHNWKKRFTHIVSITSLFGEEMALVQEYVGIRMDACLIQGFLWGWNIQNFA